MTIDHVNRIIFHYNYVWMVVVGRWAFVLFGFILAYNYVFHTKSKTKYLFRLLVFGILSQPIFIYTIQEPLVLNIFFTLALGLYMSQLFNSQKLNILFISTAVIIVLTSLDSFLPIHLDHGMKGVLMVYLAVRMLELPSSHSLYIPLWIASVAVLNFVDQSFQSLLYILSSLFAAAFIWISYRIYVNAFFIRRYKLLFYTYYPIHLLVLHYLAS